MYQFHIWAVIASLLTVIPAHAVIRPASDLSDQANGSIDSSSELSVLLAQETSTPEASEESPAEPEVEPETPESGSEGMEEPTLTEPSEPSEPTEPSEPAEPAEPTEPSEVSPSEPQGTSELILNEQGELGEGDSVLASDNSLYDEFTFDGTEGQEITITLESSEFDTYLAIFTPDNKLLEEHDDISQNDSNSQITVTLPAAGTYRVIVNSYDDKGKGKYLLKVK